MSSWVLPIVVCLFVGVFSFFVGRWSCRSNTKVGTPSASPNSESTPSERAKCDECGHGTNCGLYAPGKLCG